MAINRKWKDRNSGEMRDETCFVDLRAYGRSAETINQYMSKGQPMLVEGRLQYQQWTGQDGGKRSRHMVIIDNFQFLRGGSAGGGRRGGAGGDASSGEEQPPPPSDEDVPQQDDSGIPF
jgi:single-strand DNA-binding protein